MYLIDKKIFEYTDEKKLWSDYKKVFLGWIIGFIVGLFLLLALDLAILLVNYFTQNNLKEFLASQGVQKNQIDITVQFQFNTNLIQFIFIFAVFAYFIFSFGKAWTNKNYAYLSNFALILVAVKAFFSLITLFGLINGNFFGNSITYKVLYVFDVVYPLVLWFLVSRTVAQIRKSFILINVRKQQAQFQNFYQNIMNGGINMNGFNSNINPNQNQQTQQGTNNQASPFTGAVNIQDKDDEAQENQKNKVVLEKDENLEKLMEKPRIQLEKMAKVLNIYGYEEMNKENLCKLILKHTKHEKK